MFHEYIVPEVVSRIRDDADVDVRDEQVQAHIDESTFANAGELFVSVFPGSVEPGPSVDQHEGMEIVTGFGVGITKRIGRIPDDRLFQYAYLDDRGQSKLGRAIYASLRKGRYQPLIENINDAMDTAGEGWKLVEPFRFATAPANGAVSFVGPDHFKADPEQSDDRDFGILMVLIWEGGRFMRDVS